MESVIGPATCERSDWGLMRGQGADERAGMRAR
jgi:hypothetical protein